MSLTTRCPHCNMLVYKYEIHDGECDECREDLQEDFLPSVTKKYFPLGIDDESGVDGEPFTPTPGAW